ncbi:Protein O-mannosyltransferase 2 [Glugoides intestinalis]
MKKSQIIPCGVLILAFLVKIHRIEKGNFVTWDEAHFGKFSQSYLDRTFYFDVHPPLGKMLTALSGWLYGQSKDFEFSSKDQFPQSFDYVGMRKFHAFIASFTPLFAYLTLREFGFSLRRAFLLSFLFIFENGVVSISRLILLDSHLLSFTAGCVYFLARLFMRDSYKIGQKPESRTNLILLGVLIGCVMSVKWVGLLATSQIGLYIAADLYFKLAFMKPREFIQCFMRRVIFLIMLPFAIYTLFFYIHFLIVNKSGNDDGFMSSQFQLSLKNNTFEEMRKYISYGKMITIKTPKGYLHSHEHEYPDSTTQGGGNLQVTTYSHKDKNNNFYFQKVTEDTTAGVLVDKDRVMIRHAETASYIGQTEDEAYISEGKKVAGGREVHQKDAVWIIEIESDTIAKEEKVKTLSTRFYLRNEETGAYLCATESTYPGWGYNQGEVTARMKKTNLCLFNVEENLFSDYPGSQPYKELKATFLSRFIEHHKLMVSTNKSFAQDPDLEPDRIISKAREWPILWRGLRMTQWGENHKFYMFMNPLVLYGSTIGLIVAPVVVIWRQVRRKRSNGTDRAVSLIDNREKENQKSIKRSPIKKQARNRLEIDIFCLFLSMGGWYLHYSPFFFLGRVLYLHHYFPALFYATLNLCFLLKRLNFKICCILVGFCICSFMLYSPLTYGFLKENEVRHLKLFREWDFVDDE